MTDETKKKLSLFDRFLNWIERVGNKLPHPIALFAMFAAGTALLSAVLAALGVSATGQLVNRATMAVETQTVSIVSLLNKAGLVYMLTSAVDNFTGFAPLGVVLVAMLGVGAAETSGYIPAILKRTVAVTPRRLITPVVVFLGIMSNIASDAGYVILIPIGALIFMAYDRHPIAGLAAAFAGVSGGFSANLLIGSTDPLLSGISTEAVHIINASRDVDPTCNWYFMIVSTFLLVIVGTIVTDYIVEPRLGKYESRAVENSFISGDISEKERKALRAANLSLLILVLLLIGICIPSGSFMRNPHTGSLIDEAPLMESIIPLIMIFFLVPAAVYGYISGTFKNHRDVCDAMGKAMSSMGAYIALAFVSAQFISYFSYTHLGTVIALKGAELIKASGIGGIVLMTIFIIFSAFINLFIGSASAKWTILAPIFIPMFMLLGYSPELTQVAYRIGDSSTNIITPLMSYFAIIIVFAKEYDENSGIGTLISTMLPYSVFFLISWSLLLVAWMYLGLPLGPGAGLFMK